MHGCTQFRDYSELAPMFFTDAEPSWTMFHPMWILFDKSVTAIYAFWRGEEESASASDEVFFVHHTNVHHLSTSLAKTRRTGARVILADAFGCGSHLPAPCRLPSWLAAPS